MSIILFEGCDYSGKTTTARTLAEKDPLGVYYHSPRGITETTQTLYGLLVKNPPDLTCDVKLLFMLATNIMNIRAMNGLSEGGKHVYADRSVLSMLVYQGVSMLQFNAINAIFPIPALNVNHVFFFTAETRVLFQRYASRVEKDILDEFFMSHINDVCARYVELVSLFYPKETIHTIDTSNSIAWETVSECEKILQQ